MFQSNPLRNIKEYEGLDFVLENDIVYTVIDGFFVEKIYDGVNGSVESYVVKGQIECVVGMEDTSYERFVERSIKKSDPDTRNHVTFSDPKTKPNLDRIIQEFNSAPKSGMHVLVSFTNEWAQSYGQCGWLTGVIAECKTPKKTF
jgi:hypothetical protein